MEGARFTMALQTPARMIAFQKSISHATLSYQMKSLVKNDRVLDKIEVYANCGFFTDLSRASIVRDGANPFASIPITAFVQGFGFRGLLGGKFHTSFGCGHSYVCHGHPQYSGTL